MKATRKRKLVKAKPDDRPMQSAGLTWLPVLVILAGILAYANSLQGPFLFDDIGHITRNDEIRHLGRLSTVLDARRPAVNLSLAVNYALGELEVWGYHAFNVGVHILAALALFGVVRRTALRRSAEPRAGNAANRLALVVALIWVVHPLQTQSVSYIIQRGECLMGSFYLLTVYCVVRGADSGWRRWWYLAAIASCGLGMGSKAVMVTAPVVVLLYDRVFLSSSFRESLRRRWGLYVGLVATWTVLAACGIVKGVLNPPPNATATVGFGYAGVAPLEYALTQLGVLVHYLRLAFWPHPLCLDYDWPVASTTGAIVLPGALIVVLLGGTLWALAHKPWLGFAGAWFFLILAPTSSFIPIKDLAFEHRMYLSLAAVIVVTVVAVDWLLRLPGRRPVSRPVLLSAARVALIIVVAGALGLRTAWRNKDYRTRVGMWQNVVTQRPTNARAYCNLGVALTDTGQLQEAVEACARSVELDPGFANGHYRLGQVLKRTGAIPDAMAAFRQALRLDPGYADAHYDLGNTLFEQGETQAAAEEYQSALRVDPRYVNARVNLGNTYRKMGRSDQAVEEYRAALELVPTFADARYNLGFTLAEQGKLDEAAAEYRKTLQTDPNHALASRGLANVLYTQGRLDEAIRQYRKALQIAPHHPSPYFNLGNALMQQGRVDEAIKAYQEVLRLRPDFTPAREALDMALAQQQRLPDG